MSNHSIPDYLHAKLPTKQILFLYSLVLVAPEQRFSGPLQYEQLSFFFFSIYVATYSQ